MGNDQNLAALPQLREAFAYGRGHGPADAAVNLIEDQGGGGSAVRHHTFKASMKRAIRRPEAMRLMGPAGCRDWWRPRN
jgi:hypothetical protein